jgi:hypothetical protein
MVHNIRVLISSADEVNDCPSPLWFGFETNGAELYPYIEAEDDGDPKETRCAFEDAADIKRIYDILELAANQINAIIEPEQTGGAAKGAG